MGPTKGALIIRIGRWGPIYYVDNKEPPTVGKTKWQVDGEEAEVTYHREFRV